MDLSSAKEYIVNRLVRELPSNLTYHGAHHTFDVVKSAQSIGRAEGISTDEMFLLLTAAYYHDSGFLFEYKKNEELAVKLIKEILPEFEYTTEQIDIISDIILSTDINVQPTTLLQKIMCDSDHDYFGRKGYSKVANTLRKELIEYQTFYSDKEWVEVQINFLENKHQYYTNTSIIEKLPIKNENIELLKLELSKF